VFGADGPCGSLERRLSPGYFMDLTEYRASDAEQLRTTDLLHAMPQTGRHALDIGARDGHFSRLMAERFEHVTALDLTLPDIPHPRITCLKGDAADMPFADRNFDFVFCAEVLEHIPPAILPKVCLEIERVASGQVLIGVPYKQDIRVGRTTCSHCGQRNPPWGHVNSFDEARLASLFPGCRVEKVAFVGTNTAQTNFLSSSLMDYAGNPYGTYDQEEPCIYCGNSLGGPPDRNLSQRVATKLAFWSRHVTDAFAKPRGNWMHMVLRRQGR